MAFPRPAISLAAKSKSIADSRSFAVAIHMAANTGAVYIFAANILGIEFPEDRTAWSNFAHDVTAISAHTMQNPNAKNGSTSK